MWRHRFYALGIGLKGLDGLIETVSGLIFLSVHRALLDGWVVRATSAMIDGDADDWIARSLQHAFVGMSSGSRFFAGGYLLGHGALKLFIVIALFRRKRWAYNTAIGILCVFVVIQVSRIFYSYSTGLLLFTLTDVAIAWLIWAEFHSDR